MTTKQFYDELMDLLKERELLYKAFYNDKISYDKSREIKAKIDEINEKIKKLKFKKELLEKIKKI